MDARIRRFFTPPAFPNEEKTRIARILHVVSLTVLVGVGTIAAVTPFIFQTPAYGLTLSGLIALLMLGMRLLIRQGYVRFASRLFVTALWLFDTVLIFGSGGIESGVAPGYVAVTVLAGLLLGQAAAFAFAGLSAATGLGMLYAQNSGWLPIPLIDLTPTARWLSLTANIALAAVILYLATRSIEEALERTRRNERALADANIGLQREISERKRAEEAMRQQTERLQMLHTIDQAILEAQSPERTVQVALRHLRRLVPCRAAAAVTFDFEDQDLALTALAADEACGLDAGARLPLEGLTISEVRGDTDLPGSGGAQLEALRQGQVVSEDDMAALYEPPPAIRALQTAGVRSYIAAPLMARGELIGALGLGSGRAHAFTVQDGAVVREVADQVAVVVHQARLDAALQTERRRLETTVTHAPEGIVLLDAEQRVLLANPSGRDDLAFLAGADVGDRLERLGDRPLEDLLSSSSTARRHELTVPGSSGERGDERIFEVVARPIGGTKSGVEGPEQDTAEGPVLSAVEGWVMMLDDVTEQRQREAQVQRQERLAAVGQLAGGIAHDFRNFLSSILLYADLASRHADLPPTLRSSMETIVSESEQASELVQQILDFSRRSRMKMQPLDLKPFIEEAVHVLQRTIPENVAVRHDAGPGSYVVEADPTRIQQVLMNLALNARDAMPQGGELRIGLSRAAVGPRRGSPVVDTVLGDWVCLTVSDTGTGMTEEVQSHLFEPFFTTKAPGMGTGLGLAQVHGIVEEHHGTIDVATEVGAGTTFSVYLPACASEDAHQGEGDRRSMPRGQGERILLVEDEERVRQAISRLLASLNYEVVSAANGREALELCQAEEPALVITDMVMPTMGGRALVKVLRDRFPDAKTLVITGYVLNGALEDLEAGGVEGVIEKPFRPHRMAQTVRRVLDGP